MKTDESTQIKEHRDEAVCGRCKKRNQVTVFPDLIENKFVCRYCQTAQVWQPSARYKRTVQC